MNRHRLALLVVFAAILAGILINISDAIDATATVFFLVNPKR